MPTIRKRGTKYQAQVRIKSKGVIIFDESATFDTEKSATVWAEALERKVKSGGVEQYVKESITVAELVKRWAAYKETVRPMSRGVSHSLKTIMVAPFAAKPIAALTARDITAWGVDMSKRGLNHATILHHVMTLRAVYSSAPTVSGIQAPMQDIINGAESLKRLRVMAKSTPRERRVSDDELSLIVDYMEQQSLSVPTYDYVRLAVVFPRRRSELLTMRWSDYTGTQMLLRNTKNPNRVRDEIVPIPPEARALIDELPRFEGEDRILPYKFESISAAFQRTVKAVGIAGLRLHDLRHEGISRLFEAGLQIQEVSLISGHTNWAMLRRYTHIKPEDIVEKLSANSKRTQEDTA